jgi:hypothetical protein
MSDHAPVNLPNFLVIGAQRAGTTLLHQLLATHPEVYVPFQRKELHYFDRYFERGDRWYAGYFPDERDGRRYLAVGEVTPDYLAHPHAPGRIHATLPNCRLIAILRDPVARAFSWYQYSRRNGDERRPFERFLNEDQTVVEYGLYHKHLSRYWQLVPRHPLQVLIYEDLIADPWGAARTLASFLGLSRPFPDPLALLAEPINAGVVPRHRATFAAARRLGGYLMRHDVNWPSRLAKRLGVREWFGRPGEVAMLDTVTRHHARARFLEDAVGLGKSLDRDLVGLWRLGQEDGPGQPSSR